MVWHWTGDKPLSEPPLTGFTIYGTRGDELLYKMIFRFLEKKNIILFKIHDQLGGTLFVRRYIVLLYVFRWIIIHTQIVFISLGIVCKLLASMHLAHSLNIGICETVYDFGPPTWAWKAPVISGLAREKLRPLKVDVSLVTSSLIGRPSVKARLSIWRPHDMDAFPAFLALCAGNPLVCRITW